MRELTLRIMLMILLFTSLSSSLLVFLKTSSKLLTEARDLDDVVKILNDITGNLDAKKACTGAMEVHKKYLKKAPKQS